jgi:hypothetical protein
MKNSELDKLIGEVEMAEMRREYLKELGEVERLRNIKRIEFLSKYGLSGDDDDAIRKKVRELTRW